MEIGKILEHPALPEGIEDCVEELPGSGNNSLARAARGSDAFVEVAQIGAVPHGNERTLHQGGTGDFATTLGDPADTLAVVGLADTWRNAEESGEIAGLGKVSDVANGDQEYGWIGEFGDRVMLFSDGRCTTT